VTKSEEEFEEEFEEDMEPIAGRVQPAFFQAIRK